MTDLCLWFTLQYVLEANLTLLPYKYNLAFFHNGFVYLQCNLSLDQLALEWLNFEARCCMTALLNCPVTQSAPNFGIEKCLRTSHSFAQPQC